MNIFWKIKNYIYLKRKGVRSAWLNSRLTPLDYYFIVLIFCLIGIFVVLLLADEIDNQKVKVTFVENKLTNVKNKLHERENVIVTMLNSGYVRIDGIKRKFQQCDAAGECK